MNEEFLGVGRDRLQKNEIRDISLICGDVTTYQDNKKYDVVICSETISSIPETLLLGEKFLKAGGVLGYQKLYSKIENPPQELVDFDEEVLTLSELNDIFNQQGFQISQAIRRAGIIWIAEDIGWFTVLLK